jgi:hypothetical protein
MNGPDKLRITVAYGEIVHRADFIKNIMKEFI